MNPSNAIRHRLARWRYLSQKDKRKAVARAVRLRKFMTGIMGHEDVPREQILLESACSGSRTKRCHLDKAHAMGARPNEACNTDLELAMHNYARHGSSSFDAFDLIKRGFDPLAKNANGECFAHYAFSFLNLPMAQWVVSHCPESWNQTTDNGSTPMDLACAEPHGPRSHEQDLKKQFRDWAFSAMPNQARNYFLAHAWQQAAILMNQRTYPDCRTDLGWLLSLGAQAPVIDGSSMLLALNNCDPDLIKHAQPFFEQAIINTECQALLDVSTLPAYKLTHTRPRSL